MAKIEVVNRALVRRGLQVYDHNEVIFQLEQTQQRLFLHLTQILRPVLRTLDLSSRRAVMVTGPRGTGKTSLLLHSITNQKMLYMSADHPVIASMRLWDVAESAFKLGYDGLAIDEVHFCSNWSRDLKAIYDSYPDKTIWATDSSSLVLREGVADISRRFPRIDLPLMSFREFIFLAEGLEFEIFNPLENPAYCVAIFNKVNVFGLFRRYLEMGLRPIFMEGDYQSKILNIIEKTIFADVPFLLSGVKEQYLRLMNAVIGYLASSSVPTLNIDSLTREWGIGKEKLYELLYALEHVGLLNIVRYKSDYKASGKGAKLLLADPSMYHVLGHANTGTVREAFLVSAVRGSGRQLYACKNEMQGDFVFEDKTLEIGGKNKKPKQAQFVVRDGLDLPLRNALPLWSFGFLY